RQSAEPSRTRRAQRKSEPRLQSRSRADQHPCGTGRFRASSGPSRTRTPQLWRLTWIAKPRRLQFTIRKGESLKAFSFLLNLLHRRADSTREARLEFEAIGQKPSADLLDEYG